MAATERRMTRTPSGVYFTGSMMIPTAHGKVDLGLLARALLQGVTARPLGAGAYAVQSGNRLEQGPYRVQLAAETATCTCPAGQHGTPCKHVHLARFHAATVEENPDA